MANAIRVLYSPQPTCITETMTKSAWNSRYGNYAVLAIYDSDGNIHDFSEWVAEIKIYHESYDSDKSGRDQKTAKMKREWLADKHKLEVKMLDRIPQSVAHELFVLIDTYKKHTSFDIVYQSPCKDSILSANDSWHKAFYCATVNFGAQRYDRNDNACYYYGMTFNLIEI